MKDARVWGAFLLLGGIWGSSFLLIKIGVEDFLPFTLVAFRTGVGALGLWTIIALTRRRLPADRGTLLSLLVVGTINTALPFALITWGEQFIASSVAGVLNATAPLFTLVIAHFALTDERINWLKMVGLVVGFLGVVLIFSDELLQLANGSGGLRAALGSVQGQLAVVLAAICYAAAATFTRRKLRGVEPLVVAGGSQVVAFTLVLIAAFAFENPLTAMGQVGGSSWFAVIWLGLINTCVAYILYYFIIRQWGATRATLVTYMFPLVAFVLGAIVLGEAVTWQLFVGAALIIAGIAIVNRRAAGRQATRTTPALEATS